MRRRHIAWVDGELTGMHQGRPRVSAIVTTYRTPVQLLSHSLSSILRQTMEDLELVVVVDGPLTKSADLLDEVSRDPRARVLMPGRVGRGRALNIGLQAARAQLVAIQDADDESHPERFLRQADLLARRPDIGLLGTTVHRSTNMEDHATWALPEGPDRIQVMDRQLLFRNPIAHSSVMARRSLMDHVGGYSVGLHRHFDYELYLRIRRAGGKLAVLHQTLVLKRIHLQQMFESDAAILERIWSTYRLQTQFARRERVMYRYPFIGFASLRQLGHLMRRLRTRRRGTAPPAPQPS